MKTAEAYLQMPYHLLLHRDEEGDWVAQIEELEGCAAHGATREQALERLDEAKELWIRESIAHDLPVPESREEEDLPSGRWLQRVPRSLHRDLTRLAKLERTSLNQLVTTILSTHVGASQRASNRGGDTYVNVILTAPTVTMVNLSGFLSGTTIMRIHEWEKRSLPTQSTLLEKEMS